MKTLTLVEVPNGEQTPAVGLTAYMNAVGLIYDRVLLRSSGAGWGSAFQNISIWNSNETQQLGSMSFLAVEVPRPWLGVVRVDDTSVQIAWATNFTGYSLQVATSLPASSWEPATNSIAIEGGRFIVRLPTVGTQGLYRLRKP